ncbi:MAG: hypothetical protein QOD62_2830 [Actinomycetota bacterium]|nr:hypothetical protein [Actinomycetota bacterium]
MVETGDQFAPAPAATPASKQLRRPMAFINLTEDLVHYVVVAALLVLAGMALYKTGIDLLGRHRDLANRVIDGLNGVLFVVIVLELMTTVVAHFEHAGFQLQPFLIIGIISGVRHILTVGARLSLAGEMTGRVFRQSQIELGVEAGVVLGLGLALFLVRVKEQSQPGE